MNDFLFFILDDGRICRFNIDEAALRAVVNLLVSLRNRFVGDGVEAVAFNGQYNPDDTEVLYVDMQLPDFFAPIPDNTYEINPINFEEGDKVKVFQFQN